MSDKPVWLPNLVGGVSIWKLAPDLNEAKFMDGRLLVPETEGTDSLPSKVRWDVADLVPLRDARAAHAADAEVAVRDFLGCLERVNAAFGSEASGYAKFKDAFTVPSLEAEDGASYFYSPHEKKLKVINWGASPRAIAGSAELFFGYQAWGKLAREAGAAEAALPGAAASAAGAAGAAPAAATATAASATAPSTAADDAKKREEEKKKEDEKRKAEEKRSRPWWVWLLLVLGLLAVILLVLWLLKACDKPAGMGDADAMSVDALAEVGASVEGGAEAGRDGGDAGLDAKADADAADARDARADAADARADAGDAGKDAAKDAAGKDSGGGGGGSGGGGGAGGGGGGGGGRTFKIVPKGGGQPVEVDGDRLPHRNHFHPDAVKWRVDAGRDLLVDGQPSDGTGDSFDVYLKPGASFSGVRVSWQDAGGKWHLH